MAGSRHDGPQVIPCGNQPAAGLGRRHGLHKVCPDHAVLEFLAQLATGDWVCSDRRGDGLRNR